MTGAGESLNTVRPRSTRETAPRRVSDRVRPGHARRAARLQLLIALGLFAADLSAPATRAQDAVFLSSPNSAQGVIRVTGAIADYSSAGLVIDIGGGSRTFPAENVARIETRRIAPHEKADALSAAGDFPAALAAYRAAREQEARPWVRRQITAEIVWCCRALGQLSAAAGEFLLLVRADSATPYFDCIPLAWYPSSQSAQLEQDARTWLRQESTPAAVLLGASYLLPTELGGAALDRLRILSTSAEKTIAQLALTQTWRMAAVSADAGHVASWERTLESMPPPLRAGGYYVVGQAWARLGDWEKSALAMMRIPILHSRDRSLAARALLDAGAALERLQRREAALGLYRELLVDYPESPGVAEAQLRLSPPAGGPGEDSS